MTVDVMTRLRDFYAAEAAYLTEGAEFEQMAAHLAPDVVMYQASSLPYGGEWHGHEGFRRFIAAMGDNWDGLWFDEQQFVSDRDRVVVYSRGRLRARRTGRTLETSLLQWISFRDGLITEFRPYYHDTSAVLAALTE
ncbi:nuclear transport factor 2 family protein [Nocardia sp. CDC153]|uniref:nuclear transport factor 2 family protein n=1 Tax=Nocardia sp. CDC153 TaxID=3112167 RepID=UPI002DB9D6D5|nr:nuclear transport factor 2 family protein [Nocardia sp. CDC153]MEC3956625.1 nuclear transport factor 2 family protein [Nocardia sp. CDC153]